MSMSDGTGSYRNTWTTGDTATDATQQGDDQVAGMVETAREAQGALKDSAVEAVETAKDAVTEMAGQTQDQAGEIISQVTDQVASTITDVREQAVTTFTEQRDRAVSTLNALADLLREAVQSLDDKKGDDVNPSMAAVGPFVSDAANRLSQSADFLKDKNISGLFGEAQQLARKQPMLFVASMFGIGLAGARMLKGTVTEAADAVTSQPQGGSSSSMPSGFGGSSNAAGDEGTPIVTGGTQGLDPISDSSLNPSGIGYARPAVESYGDLPSFADVADGRASTDTGWGSGRQGEQ